VCLVTANPGVTQACWAPDSQISGQARLHHTGCCIMINIDRPPQRRRPPSRPVCKSPAYARYAGRKRNAGARSAEVSNCKDIDISTHRLAATQPFGLASRMLHNQGLPIRSSVQVGHFARNLVINILILFLVCGCVAHPRSARSLPTKVAPMGMRQAHRHSTAGAAKITRHELTDTEKDRLFRNFMRWLAADDRVEVGALVKAGQAPETEKAVQPASD
jgi:hypothetical protein